MSEAFKTKLKFLRLEFILKLTRSLPNDCELGKDREAILSSIYLNQCSYSRVSLTDSSCTA